MLRIEKVNVSYGSIHALHDISLTVNDGEVVSLIGANGAGKTTTLHTITGLKGATDGVIEYDGKDLRRICLLYTSFSFMHPMRAVYFMKWISRAAQEKRQSMRSPGWMLTEVPITNTIPAGNGRM